MNCALRMAPCLFQLFFLSVLSASKFRPSLRLEDLNSSSLMLPFISNSINEEAKLDARIARVRKLLGQFEAEHQEEQDNFLGPVFYDGDEEFVYNEYEQSQPEDYGYWLLKSTPSTLINFQALRCYPLGGLEHLLSLHSQPTIAPDTRVSSRRQDCR